VISSPTASARSAGKGAAPTGHQRSGRRWDKAGYVVLFTFLALTAAQCVRLGTAGLLVQTAQAEVERWTPTSRAPSIAEIRRTTKYFTESLEYTPDNPWALEGTGALDLARMRASRVPREAHAAARDARARFRQALLQRPTSPFLWANLALTKLYLGEIDDELRTALRHADELGPWEPSAQQTTLFVGLAVWRDLDPALQQALAKSIERGASRNAKKMFEIVKSYARFDLVCAIEKYQPVAAADCRKTAETAKPGAPMNKGYRQ